MARPQHRGTYSDLAFKFVEEFGHSDGEKLLLVQFFVCVRHFVVHRFNADYW